MPIGTIVNVIAVLVGAGMGLLLKGRFPEKVQTAIFNVMGLFTATLGLQMAFKPAEPLIILFGLVIGAIIGTVIGIDARLEGLVSRFNKGGEEGAKFSEGMITAFLLFCVGSMTFVGAINEGLQGNSGLLITKSILDGCAAIALTSTYGKGVAFSVIPLFIFQAGLTLFARQFQPLFTEQVISSLTAVGGLLVLGVGLNLLKLTKLKIADYLPALLVVLALAAIFK